MRSVLDNRLHPGGAGARPLILELAERWLKASDDTMARWLEVTQWLVETQAKGRAGLLSAIGTLRQSLG